MKARIIHLPSSAFQAAFSAARKVKGNALKYGPWMP